MKCALALFLLGAIVWPTNAAEPLKITAILPTKPYVAGDDVTLEIVVSTDGDETHTFMLGAFPQAFGVYVLGPWGIINPDPSRVRPENWMHGEHSAAAKITITKDKPYRTTMKLSDYYKVDATTFKPGLYQINVKFYDSRVKLTAPIDTGALRFEMGAKK